MKTLNPFLICIQGTLLLAFLYTLAQPFPKAVFHYIPLLLWGAVCIQYSLKSMLLFLILMIFLSFSLFQYQRQSLVNLPFQQEKICEIRGNLYEEVSWNSQGKIYMKVDLMETRSVTDGRGGASGLIGIQMDALAAADAFQWQRGDEVSIAGRFAKGDHNFFYGHSILHLKRIHMNHFRKKIMRRLYKRARRVGALSETLMPALVLGLKHPELGESSALFREIGCSHIIALSGFHSGLIALLIFSVFKGPFGFKGALVAACLGLLIYLYLAGPKPSLIRSVQMFLMLGLSKIFLYRLDLKRVLLFSYFLTAIYSPASLHTISAQLSYLALWGILSTSPIFASVLEKMGGRLLSLALSASLAAQIWTLPYVLFFFSVWYPAGIGASIILTPIITVYMYGALVLLIVPDWDVFTFLPLQLCLLLERLLSTSASIFQKLPSIMVENQSPGLFLILLFPLLLGQIYRPGLRKTMWKKKI